MTGQRNGRGFECLIIDINTQRDFCDGNGAFPVANIAELVPTMRRLIAWAKRNFVPIVSSIESHRPFELSDSGNPICCVDGSLGQYKLDFTIFPRRAVLEVDNTLNVPIDVFRHNQQIIFRKRTSDLLSNPKADSLLSSVPVNEFIAFGNGLEDSIKAVALALLAREKRVTIVVDACGYWHKSTADLALRQMAAKGATLITVDELIKRKLDRRMRRRWRPVEQGNGKSNGNGNGHGNGNGNGHNGQHRPINRNGYGTRPTNGARRTVANQDNSATFFDGI